MQKRTIAMIAVVGCAVTMLTGCGVPQEEYDAKIGELDTAAQEIVDLKGQIADLDSQVTAEKALVRTSNTRLKDANEQLAASKAKESETADALSTEQSKVSRLENSLSSEKESVADAEAEAAGLSDELDAQKEAYKVLKARWDQFETHLNTLDDTAGPAKEATPDDGKSAMDLLNEMSAE